MRQGITLEQVEQLAAQVEADDRAERQRLQRLIAAEARILSVREPELYRARPLEVSDEDGHWDDSYPPAVQYKDYSGPRLLSVRKGDYGTIATEGGFYHTWRAVTQDRGLYVARDGSIWGREYDGQGRLGRFAARPGDYGVMIAVRYDETDGEDLTLEDLRRVEQKLRELAFPLTAAAEKATEAGR